MLTIIIPTYNSSKYLKQCLDSIVNIKSVSEIIISDDNSDKNNKKLLKDVIHTFHEKNKIKYVENTPNLGAFYNKFNAVKHSSNELVYILDSDNIAGFNLNKIINTIQIENNENFLYIPSKIYHFYNNVNFLTPAYKTLMNNLETFSKNNLTLDSKDINSNFNKRKFIMEDATKSIYWILNIGNFIVYKNNFLKNMENKLMFDRKLLSMDAVAFSYYWLKNGKKLRLLKNHYHFHRKRLDSVSWVEKEDSKISRSTFDQLFKVI